MLVSLCAPGLILPGIKGESQGLSLYESSIPFGYFCSFLQKFLKSFSSPDEQSPRLFSSGKHKKNPERGFSCVPGAGLEHYMFSTGCHYFLKKILGNLFKSGNGFSEENPAPAPAPLHSYPNRLALVWVAAAVLTCSPGGFDMFLSVPPVLFEVIIMSRNRECYHCKKTNQS